MIKQNERRRLGNDRLTFFEGIDSATSNLQITNLSWDFTKMRNDLIHEGHLSGTNYPGHTKAECSEVVADVLNWIDEYIHGLFGIIPVTKVRYPRQVLSSLNSYTTW